MPIAAAGLVVALALESRPMSESPQTWTIKRLLEWTAAFFGRKSVDPARLSAELLPSHVLSIPRIKLYTDFDRVLSDAQLATFRELVKRAAEQEPIAYLTGKAHFFNLEFEVSRAVLIPRPDTETVVENVLQLVRRTTGFETPRVLDLCTGSGCIAAAIAHHNKNAIVVATEISPDAMAIARQRRPGPCVRPSKFFTGSSARIRTAAAFPFRSTTTFMHQYIP